MTRSGLARLLGAYLFHRKRLWFWALFAVLLAAYTVNIKLAVELNDWNGRFYDALQRVDKDAIYRELVFFIGLAAVIIALLVSAGYLKDRVIIALRRDITYVFFDRWLSPASAHYLLRESGKEPDNPDQRMSEDVKNLVSLSLNLSVSLFDSLLTIGSFSVILWTLSGSAEVFGITVPGYMFWVCLIYTAFSTWLTHFIGRKLKTYNIGVQHKEADLRAALMEKRRHADAIAGARGEATEAVGLHEKFGSLMDMLINLVKKQRDLDFFTVGLGQFTHLAPIFFSLPAFLAGHIQLGGLMQIRGAFGDVARSLSWIIFCYDDLAKLSAAYARLKRLEAGLTEAETLRKRLLPVQSGAGQNLTADLQLTVSGHSSDAARKLSVKLTLKPGTLTLLTGTSGIGTSTLMKGFMRALKDCSRSRTASIGFRRGVTSSPVPCAPISPTPGAPRRSPTVRPKSASPPWGSRASCRNLIRSRTGPYGFRAENSSACVLSGALPSNPRCCCWTKASRGWTTRWQKPCSRSCGAHCPIPPFCSLPTRADSSAGPIRC